MFCSVYLYLESNFKTTIRSNFCKTINYYTNFKYLNQKRTVINIICGKDLKNYQQTPEVNTVVDSKY